MTREEAIEYAEKKNLKLEEEIERPGSYYGAYAMYSTELEFVSMAISALRQQDHFREVTKKVEPLTNAQKIRAMSDEEFAEFLIDLADDGNLRIREWLQQPAEEDDMTDCKHEFVYDELHGEIVCKFCGYVLTADDKRELHRKAFELMEDEEGAD